MAEDKKVEAGKKTGAKKPNPLAKFFKSAVKFIKDCRGEVKKIVWPTAQQTFKNTGVVLVAIGILGLFVFGVDSLFMRLLRLVMDVSGT